jgi:hypothetical protein
MADTDALLAELAQRYEIRYSAKLADLTQHVNELNRQALSRKAKPFRIVTVVKDGEQWAAILERSPQSLTEYLGGDGTIG